MMHNRLSLWCAVLAAVATAAGQDADKPGSGQQLVLQSARNLINLPGLEAEFHYRVEAYDQTLLGSGRYLQAGAGPDKLFRLELSTQLQGRKATQQTICGKQYLWVRRDLGPEDKALARVTLRRLRQALEQSDSPQALDPTPTWMSVVGMPKLLSSLAGWFTFEPAQRTTLGNRQVLRLSGVIKDDLRRELLGVKKGQGGEQIPDALELTLGTDQALPLFPYRIAYLKRADKDDPARLTPLLTLDFTSAKVRKEIDLQQFEYFPGDQAVEDRTRLFLERLGLAEGEVR